MKNLSSLLFAAFTAAAAFTLPAHAVDVCSPQIQNNSAAAGVCGPVCDKTGGKFGGNWSNDTNHPPVKACISGNKGQAVCGCTEPPPKPTPAPTPAPAAAAACWWMESSPPYAWKKNGGMPATTEAACKQLDSCAPGGGKGSGGGCYIWSATAPGAAPPPAPKINVKKAIYGENCPAVNKAKMDLASNFKKACDGKDSCTYTINAFGVDGDPAPNCPKDLVVTYSCGSADKTVKVDKEAHSKPALMSCK